MLLTVVFLFLTLVQARDASSSATLHMVASKPGYEIPWPDFEEAFVHFHSISVTPSGSLPEGKCPSASWFAGNLQC